ncbi:hypothetical protein, partial [Pantoea agglomerans]|uniref:hypothetical protein n=1 Tax=Enterobacter agglomerans TaxID=549 RepID=UPI003C7D2CDD
VIGGFQRLIANTVKQRFQRCCHRHLHVSQVFELRCGIYQRAITEAASVMESATIDTLLPTLVNQYQDSNVFGGGIWPLPN